MSPEGAREWVDRGLDVLERNKEVGRGLPIAEISLDISVGAGATT